MDNANDSHEGQTDQQTSPRGDTIPSPDVNYVRNEDDGSFGEDKPLIPP